MFYLMDSYAHLHCYNFVVQLPDPQGLAVPGRGIKFIGSHWLVLWNMQFYVSTGKIHHPN